MKILSWNTEKGPIGKQTAIEQIIRRVAPHVAFLYEASNAVDSYSYPKRLADAFSADYELHESPYRRATGPTGMVVLIARSLSSEVTVKDIQQKRYAVIERNGLTGVGLHIQSPALGEVPAKPPYFDKKEIASCSFVSGDFNQVITDPAVTSLITAGMTVVNPNPRIPTSTKRRPIDHTLAAPGQVTWGGYENTDFAASDHLAQVFYWI